MNKKVDMVWLEDQKWFVDDLVRRYYSHLKIDVYYDPFIFMENIGQYPLDTRIILDTYYEDARGEIIPSMNGFTIAKELHEMGYTNLILYAGAAPETCPEYLKIVLKRHHTHEGDTALDKV